MKEENVLLTLVAVLTITSTAPVLARAGIIHVIVVLFTTLIDVATVPSNVTALAPVKFVPVIVTLVPPSVLPDDGEILVITGGGVI